MTISDQLAKIAHEGMQREICGVVTHDGDLRCSVVRVTNRASDNNSFLLDEDELHNIMRTKKVVACWHTHGVGDDHLFSQNDIMGSELSGYVYFVYSIVTERINRYAPKRVRLNLANRLDFVPQVFDCFSLVQDYYQDHLETSLVMFPSDPVDYRNGVSAEKEEAFCNENKLIEVTEPKNGSIVCMQIGQCGHAFNHVGIYEDGYVIHHPWKSPVRTERFTRDSTFVKFLHLA